jgi:hypothetical protein
MAATKEAGSRPLRVHVTRAVISAMLKNAVQGFV